ncbi:glycosyltransferase [Candidatus Roizmanbacteria bacterium]|nr:glycosyltransferase [Candidatus Roizmanbacteria bacterium]
MVKIYSGTKKGTEIFGYLLINALIKRAKRDNLSITAFASGTSKLPVPIESINYRSSMDDKSIGNKHHTLFELALFSKAFLMHKQYDLFHVSTGIAEYILPFAQLFSQKPIIITLHGPLNFIFQKKFFSLYKKLPNVYFVSICNAQRKPIPDLNYIRTIYHGIDIHRHFHFNNIGSDQIIWTGRAIPDKGLDVFLTVIKKVKRKAKVFPIIKEESLEWLNREFIKKRSTISQILKIYIDFDVDRIELAKQYQTSKLFLFPVQAEEAFGLTLIESMACGTPVVAYARGSIPEIVKDGETGFIVNPSDDDIRGDWIIKKTGIEGLCEAVERIYAMPEDQYKQMRLNCRAHVEKNFTVEHMVDQYVEVYKEILAKKTT